MEELARKKKVLNMMITAHTVLADNYHRRSVFFEIFLLSISVILNALVFVDEKFVSDQLSINAESQKLIIGLISILIFAISLILLQVKWREKSENHVKASNELCTLLQQVRALEEVQLETEKQILEKEFDNKYVQIMGMIEKIPHSKFNRLKLIHTRKVELSKLIDKNPGSYILILRIKLLLQALKGKSN